MPRVDRVAQLLTLALCALAAPGMRPAQAGGPQEWLQRGTVAVRTGATSAFVSWRLLATDQPDARFDLDRSTPGQPTRRLTAGPLAVTHFVDAGLEPGRAYSYQVRPVGGGFAFDPLPPVAVAADPRPYHEIPVRPEPGYTPNDGSVGDLDGDGEYELVVHMTGRGRDNSQDGPTDPPILDAYKLDGTRLWSIRLGRNIREGAHYTQFLVFDFDRDGRSEVACKTADGSTDGQGKIIGDPAANHVDPATGRILRGPEFLTVFDGRTGAALATADYVPGRGDLGGWGGVGGNGGNDRVGNRADRFLACVAYLDGELPSLVMCRGYYGRTVLAAWDYRAGKLTPRWVFDTNDGHPEFAGQGNHNLSVADVDGDGRDEIIYGSMVVDDDGRGLFSTGLRHGDALHVGDLDPGRPGLEVYGIHENEANARNDRPGTAMYDAKTGAILWTTASGVDVGRGLAADIDPGHPGAECWGGPGGLRTARGEPIGPAPRSANFAVWWDGDPLRELLDGTRISKWDPVAHRADVLLSAEGCLANNGTKATPVLAADLWGDWREEVILRAADNRSLRVYTSTIPTVHRLVTLMHDPQYRLAIAWQNVGYNQPPHPSFFLGDGVLLPGDRGVHPDDPGATGLAQNASAETTSPPATVPMARQARHWMAFLMKWTLPSANRVLTPPGW